MMDANEKHDKRHVGKCYDCGNVTELFELDIRGGSRIMKCQICGLHHFYRRNLLGNWKLLKVSKNIESDEQKRSG